MPWNILLLPLLGGFFFATLEPRLAYRVNRLNKERLLLFAAAWGIVLAILSFVVTRYLANIAPEAASLWKSYFPDRFSGTAFGALILGMTGGFLSRCFLLEDEIDQWIVKWVEEHGNELETLFFHAARKQQPIIVNLLNDKVYIGTIQWAPSKQATASSHFILRLYASGYRKPDDKTLRITNPYYSVIKEVIRERDLLLRDYQCLSGQLNSLPKRLGDSESTRHQEIQEEMVATARKIQETRGLISDMNIVIPFEQVNYASPFNSAIHEKLIRHRDGEHKYSEFTTKGIAQRINPPSNYGKRSIKR